MGKFSTKEPQVDVRVELSPACDLWMQGAKFGRIVSVCKEKRLARVYMDNVWVRHVQVIPFDYLRREHTGAEYGDL